MLPITSEIGVRLTRKQAQSALPHAPVLEDEPGSPPPGYRRRARLAAVLRRAADRVEPSRRHLATDC